MIAFFGAFHGRTMGAVSLTASKPQQKRRFGPLVPGVTHIRYPDVYRGCEGGPQDAEAFALGCARFIEDKLFKTTIAPEEVAAIFVEPIQGEGGYVIAPTIFMQELRRICDTHGIMLVVDEVQSGVGRTGKWWAVQHTGVEPDMICFGKKTQEKILEGISFLDELGQRVRLDQAMDLAEMLLSGLRSNFSLAGSSSAARSTTPPSIAASSAGTKLRRRSSTSPCGPDARPRTSGASSSITL